MWFPMLFKDDGSSAYRAAYRYSQAVLYLTLGGLYLHIICAAVAHGHKANTIGSFFASCGPQDYALGAVCAGLCYYCYTAARSPRTKRPLSKAQKWQQRRKFFVILLSWLTVAAVVAYNHHDGERVTLFIRVIIDPCDHRLPAMAADRPPPLRAELMSWHEARGKVSRTGPASRCLGARR